MTKGTAAGPDPSLPRRLVAELLGTGFLVTVVVGSGIAAQRLSPRDVGLQLLENSTATFLGLTVLIVVFGPVSGAHFNPVVSATTRPPIPQIVFACVRNGGRSVASRVLAEHYAGGRVIARSAGTRPGEHIHPEVAAALEELGVDTSHEHPKLLTRDMIAASDVAITLGCGEECPYVPGVKYVDWPVDDPGGQNEATVRRIIADLDTRVRNLLVELVPELDLPPSVLEQS